MAAHTVSGHATFDGAPLTASASFTVTVAQATRLFGANFGVSTGPDTSKYPATVRVARLFNGGAYPADITTMAGYQAAKARGATVILLDEPATVTQSQLTGHIQSVLNDGMIECMDAGVHEPEHNNKMAPGPWVDLQVKLAPWIRAAGGLVVPILQASTVAGIQGRVLSDYNLPPGTADRAGFDLYPQGIAVMTQAQLLPAIEAAAQSVYGCDPAQIVFGEYGVTNGAADSLALLQAFKAWAANHVSRAAYWSQDTFALTQAEATAWF